MSHRYRRARTDSAAASVAKGGPRAAAVPRRRVLPIQHAASLASRDVHVDLEISRLGISPCQTRLWTPSHLCTLLLVHHGTDSHRKERPDLKVRPFANLPTPSYSGLSYMSLCDQAHSRDDTRCRSRYAGDNGRCWLRSGPSTMANPFFRLPAHRLTRPTLA
ncbi:Piso0_002112 [Millerozyma farinosa CBS 7064]|uniref:Piso0_002112 protein n=1 Tax=Pichia sorbitophila (strain ATCC MYA-4447 / BCRC 22081 / CBS 7064 / NBRC 10061 / NRRL Y-12695) TaxID=559304 RepID=G8YBQ6_PICSO|nr:Piso0_002112 [Millerozyma farinosa CBS 7064]